MTIHISATTGCNLGCSYCYENPDRERKQEWVDRQYDIEAIMERLEELAGTTSEVPGMHGGEPLLVRKEHLERIWSFIYDEWGRSHIQTNGTLIDEDHLDLFERYNVHVGVSCDGPDELNAERKAAGERGTEEGDVTDRMTMRTNDAIHAMRDRGIGVGVIVVLHETNAGTDDRLERLLEWMDDLAKRDVHGHYNPAIPYEDIQTDLSLGADRLERVYLRTWEWLKEASYRRWNPMNQYVDNLLGISLGNCVNNRCDVFNAGAAKIVKGDGEWTGCGKTWDTVGDGVPFLQGPSSDEEWDDSEERYEMLKRVPGAPDRPEGQPDLGGCHGCRYWNVCQGGCPSAGETDDYRDRTVWCRAKYALYERIERDLRALMPNITLVTDLPWDAPLNERARRWELDIKPFAAMDPALEGRQSSFGAFEHPFGRPLERVNVDVDRRETWQEKVERYRREVPEDHLEVDEEEQTIHTDSRPHDPDPDGWELVEEAADD